ncbi:hypothetical protein [Nostoc sp.]|uniref:hypothetical protein n=1 Tax=Nostoc sp. TaxID=1180 RepID=UPI002FFC5372
MSRLHCDRLSKLHSKRGSEILRLDAEVCLPLTSRIHKGEVRDWLNSLLDLKIR